MIILMAGLPASGKSTLAKALARKIRATVLRTDLVRKQLFEKPTYSREEKLLVYKVTFLIAEYLARAKVNVILDGTFYKRELRNKVYQIGKKTRTKVFVVECCAPEAVIKERMERRKLRGSLSDADFEVYKKISREFEPIQRPHIIVDSSRSIKENVSEVLRRISKKSYKSLE